MALTFSMPLSKLRFGHEAPRPINARRTDREADLEALAGSLQAHGQISPLVVTEIDGTWYVVDGNRRLAAFQRLVELAVYQPDPEILCTTLDDSADAEEISLAANVMRLPLHEADMYETFRELADRGTSEAAIASRFGIEPKRVRRMLALGRLSPMILDAWRNGELGHHPVECVRAFTLARDTEQQEEVFVRLVKAGSLTAYAIRRELGASDRDAGKLLAFIGREAYVGAGGHVTEDLFGDHHILSDPALAEAMARSRITEACEELTGQGWSWAKAAVDMPPTWTYSWQRLEPTKARANPRENKALKEARAIRAAEGATEEAFEAAGREIAAIEEAIAARGWTAEQKAQAGCVVGIGDDGSLSITYGVVTPSDAKKAAKEAKRAEAGETEPGAEKQPKISAALLHRLSIQATLGLRETLAKDPHIGLVALLAGFLTVDFYRQPVKVQHQGYGHSPVRDGDSYADVFARLLDMTDEQLWEAAAGIAATAVDLTTHNANSPPLGGANGVLAAALDAGELQKALAAQFDAQDYFGSAPKALTIRAIREAINEDEARKASKMDKATLVAFAFNNVPQTGWLPPELRAETYTGPGAVKAGGDEREAA